MAHMCLTEFLWAQVSTLIGYGSPNKANTHGVHGAPLGSDETQATRDNLKWEYGEFEIPQSVYDLFGDTKKRGAEKEEQWNKDLEEYSKKYPEVCVRACERGREIEKGGGGGKERGGRTRDCARVCI